MMQMLGHGFAGMNSRIDKLILNPASKRIMLNPRLDQKDVNQISLLLIFLAIVCRCFRSCVQQNAGKSTTIYVIQ